MSSSTAVSASSSPAVYGSSFLEPGPQDPHLGLIVLNRPLARVTAHLWQRGGCCVGSRGQGPFLTGLA